MGLWVIREGGRVNLCRTAVCFAGIVLLLFCLALSASAVTKVNSQSLHDDLFSVSFPTENDGWVCGRWGTVLHTADGGKTWQRQKTNTDYTLSSIHFVDLKNGWAVGDEGTIVHTSDGGTTWQKQKSPVPFFLMGVHFVTPLKGWIITERTHILSTDNGGKTWNIQFKEDDFVLKAVSFCDPLNGWAVGEYGLIYNTKDGGKTWTKQAGFFGISEETGQVVSGDQLFGVVAVDAQTAWAVGIDGHITKTVDGGKNWTKIDVPTAKTQLYGVMSNKAGEIVIAGKRTFFISPDKGKVWRNAKIDPPFPYGWIYGLARRGSSGFVAVGQEGAIYLSKPKAFDTWQRVKD
jgi:photosystem II stability/assembly factor-like uncharacterized protein